MHQANDSRWDGKKSGQACGDGRQQAYDESFDDGRLSIVPIPMSLRSISYEAKNDPHRQGDERTDAQSDELPAKEHGIDNHGEQYNPRIKAEDLTKTSRGNGDAVVRQWIGRNLLALYPLHLRGKGNGVAADRAESAISMNLTPAMSAYGHGRDVILSLSKDLGWRSTRFGALWGHVLLHIHCMETQSIEQSGDAGLGVLPGFQEDAVGERGLGNLLLGSLAYLGFEVQVRRDKQAGGPGIDL
jgi:hypothetical protein